MTAGAVALATALIVATAVGFTWRAASGRMRSPHRMRSPRRLTPAAAGAAPADEGARDPGPAGVTRVTMAEIGQPLGERATLLQFSSAFCAPCRATRRILADVAGLTAGVTHVEIDAESRLDLVRVLGVLRTPTVLVLAADGRVVRRASGQPRKADVIGALGEAIDRDGAPARFPIQQAGK